MNRPNDEFEIAMEFVFAVFILLASRIHHVSHFAHSEMYELVEWWRYDVIMNQ